jgi:hypothetical protein
MAKQTLAIAHDAKHDRWKLYVKEIAGFPRPSERTDPEK